MVREKLYTYPESDMNENNAQDIASCEEPKIIARMPNLESNSAPFRWDAASIWNWIYSNGISEQQQNRALWCIVVLLLCIISWGIYPKTSTQETQATKAVEKPIVTPLANEPYRKTMETGSESVVKTETNTNAAAAESQPFVDSEPLPFAQTEEHKEIFAEPNDSTVMELPTTTIDLSSQARTQSETNSVSGPVSVHSPRSVWEREDNTTEQNPWTVAEAPQAAAPSVDMSNYKTTSDRQWENANAGIQGNGRPFDQQSGSGYQPGSFGSFPTDQQVSHSQNNYTDNGANPNGNRYNNQVNSPNPNYNAQYAPQNQPNDYSRLNGNASMSNRNTMNSNPAYQQPQQYSNRAPEMYANPNNNQNASFAGYNQPIPNNRQPSVAGSNQTANRELIPVQTDNTMRPGTYQADTSRIAVNYQDVPRYDGQPNMNRNPNSMNYTQPVPQNQQYNQPMSQPVGQPIDPRFN